MTILSETIKRLHLRPNAPYPSEQLRAKQAEKEAHEAIRKWRESQRMHLVKDDMNPLNNPPQNWHDRSQIGWNHD